MELDLSDFGLHDEHNVDEAKIVSREKMKAQSNRLQKVEHIMKYIRSSLFELNADELDRLGDQVTTMYYNQMNSGNNLLHFDVKVQGSMMKAMLDCGATREFIDYNVALKRGFKMEKLTQSFSVRLANSQTLQCEYYIPVELKFKQFKHKCELYVVDLNEEHELIIGQSFLKRRNPIVDWVTGEMTLRKSHANNVESVTTLRTCNAMDTSDVVIDAIPEDDNVVDVCSLALDEREAYFDSMASMYDDAIVQTKTFKKILKRQKRKDNAINVLVWIWRNDSGEACFSIGERPNEGYTESVQQTERDSLKHDIMERYSDTLRSDLPAKMPPVRWDGAEMVIEDGDPISPPAAKAIRLNDSQLKELRAQLQYYLERGFIRPSKSNYAAPVFFAAKPHTNPVKWRMCTDYRLLNTITKRDAYPLPAPDQLIDRLSGAKYFTKLDLTQYFHQIPVNDDSIHKTAFTTRYGNYEWLVTPFGLCNAPAVAMRMAHQAFFEYIDDFVIIFMDDVLIFSKTKEEHIEHVEKVFQRMREKELYAHPDKCEFLCDNVWYLGLGISPDGTFISDVTKDAIRKWEVPKPGQKNKKGNRKANPDGKTAIRTFLGMVSFFRKFIPRLSERAKPISDLLDASRSFNEWGAEQDAAFEDLKNALLDSSLLQIPDPKLPYVIYPDMSKVGVGGVLMQDQGLGLKPCAYMSQKLDKTKMRRGAYETELWALIKCLKTWKHYLYGSSVEIRTDHAPLKYINTQGKLTDKVVRWLDFLSEFDFIVKHVPRELNTAADMLSKNPRFYETEAWRDHQRRLLHADVMHGHDVISVIGQATYAVMCLSVMTTRAAMQRKKHMEQSLPKSPVLETESDGNLVAKSPVASVRNLHADQMARWREQLVASYQSDDFCKRVIQKISSYHNYALEDGILYRSDTYHGLRIYVPKTCMVTRSDGVSIDLRSQLLYEYHDSLMAGHQGIRRSLFLLSRYFWWPTMRSEMISHVKSCLTCQKAKRRHVPLGKFVGFQPPERRWEDVSFDFITNLPLTKNGNNAIHVIMDQTSRRIRLDACNMTITAEGTAAMVFNSLVRNHGLPRRIISDRDTRYTAQIWNAIWKMCGTKLAMSPAHDPLTNAANERSHAVIEDMMRSYVSDVSEWDLQLAIIEFAINNQPNIDTKRTPFEIDCGQHPLDPITMTMSRNSTFGKAGLVDDWNKVTKAAVAAYKEAQQRRLDKVNSRRYTPNFDVGDKVFMSTEFLVSHEGEKRGKKLRYRWAGPFEVVRMTKNKLAAELEFGDVSTTIHPVIPVSRLKRAIEPEAFSRRSRVHLEPPLPERYDEDEEYEVEAILDRRFSRRQWQYLIKFVGYDYQYNQWLPERELRETCEDLIEQYEIKYPRV